MQLLGLPRSTIGIGTVTSYKNATARTAIARATAKSRSTSFFVCRNITMPCTNACLAISRRRYPQLFAGTKTFILPRCFCQNPPIANCSKLLDKERLKPFDSNTIDRNDVMQCNQQFYRAKEKKIKGNCKPVA